MRKAITPIISIIVLLLITVSLAGVAYVYLFGFLGTRIDKTFSVPPSGIICTDVGGTNEIIVVVTNTGTSTLTDDDFVLVQIDGNPAAVTGAVAGPPGPIYNVSIDSGDGGVLLRNDNGGAGWPSGTHQVDISTPSSTFSVPVLCP